MDESQFLAAFDAQFKFRIGDTVWFKLAVERMNETDGHSHPNEFTVTDRLLQQCHGGIQKLYALTPIPEQGRLGVSEPCLVKADFAQLVAAIAKKESKQLAKEVEQEAAVEAMREARWKARDEAKKQAKEEGKQG